MTSSISPSYLRFPHLHGNLLTFVAEDDVWLAEIPADGASVRAWRATSDRAPAGRPRISPDGERLAWTGQRDGAPEAYVMPVEGGEATRLTYWGAAVTGVRNWLSADEIVVVTDAEAFGWNEARAFAVPAAGGVPRLLPYGYLQDLDTQGPEGAVLLRRGLTRDASAWKRYRGGTAGRLWLDRDGSGTFERFLPDHEGNIGVPLWVGDRAAFLSDVDGVSELYSCLPDGTDLRRHTHDPAGYFARQAASDGARVVFARAGKLYLLDSLADGAEPRLLDVRLTGTRVGRAPHPVDTAKHLHAITADHTGRASVVEVRGTVHWLTHKEGPARVLQAEPGVRNRLPVVLGETGQVAWVTDADGDYALEIGAVEGGARRRILSGGISRVHDLVASPDGEHLAIATEDNRLLIIDVETGTMREVASGEHCGWPTFATGPVFSPDSAWLAWSQASPVPDAYQIRLADVATLTPVDVTQPRFHDWSPSFTLDGKHLVFLSARTFDPHYTEYGFDLDFVPGVRPYLVPLAADEPSPFAPQLGGRPVGDEDKDKDEDKKKAEKAENAEPAETSAAARTTAADGAEGDSGADPAVVADADTEEGDDSDGDDGDDDKDKKDKAPKTVVDAEGIASRVVPFPVRSGHLAKLRAAKGGVLWLEHPVSGGLGDSLAGPTDEGDEPWLRRFDFAKREASTLVDDLTFFEVSGDGNRIVVLDGKTMRVQPSDSRPDNGDKQAVDLDRIRLTVDPVAERRQGLREAWLLQRDFFWRDDLAGIDWPAALAKYEPLVEAVATGDDFVDLLWEMQGELGTSHAYAHPNGRPTDAAKSQGLLGADLAREESGAWRITRILPGDSSLHAARSPLEAPGVAARAGDVIEAVDGYPVTAALGPNPLLAGKAGKPVALTLRRDGAEPRHVVVVPLSSDDTLRYRARVSERRAYVAEQSGGRLGYLHLPDQGQTGWAEFHRDVFGEFAKEGLVVDTRSNGGGNTSELISEKLLRKPLGWSISRGMTPTPYPSQTPRGPVVVVCDENAGSDGDIVNQVLKDNGVPIVGVRTWGGVVGIDSRFRLLDGTSVTQPKYGNWFNSVGYGLENHGVDPTVEVPIAPQDVAAGRDPQLDTAIRIALAALAERPAANPPERPWLTS